MHLPGLHERLRAPELPGAGVTPDAPGAQPGPLLPRLQETGASAPRLPLPRPDVRGEPEGAGNEGKVRATVTMYIKYAYTKGLYE